MSKLYRILGFVALLFILVTSLTFALSIVVVGAAVTSLFGIYRFYVAKKISRNNKSRSKAMGYSSGEIIDMNVDDRKE
ncbi:hypothetical protein [Desulfitobacterium sp.]|uniref:hypothetical protein n=1 Tax=Desulfitobacterium sp. TaxID=49981 RepID=UPI002C261349|nr:hypothetical protein [Desulfitobacterium sp.]HVJ49030.1 hypothetical protein [Desulfitobacterium sp.]